ncbi:hypothetical protein GM661_04830 [Iocasia frigidifontis]|uniref:Uncharacterized protein n=1 Tax=Iocasia fonsfrigidae TaxID=2682810 RepID=A0A8A7KCM5_9FIRM|nr:MULTISPECIES: hypothetical protein [Halanaerobiaceae]AZO94421.1 hypothetical protein D7D81_07290 [Halocella sp. SP3-1]QTL97358.1 hypothetical protein GM661_04830 [Iocasia fonsfrigidae]
MLKRSLILVLVFVFILNLGVSAKEVELKSGTIIFVETTSMLDPDQLQVGDNVSLIVSSDVLVNNTVVIEAGSPVIATVTSSKESGLIGMAGKLGLNISSVEAVDGTYVALSGSKMVEGKDSTVASAGLSLLICPLFALMKGEDAKIPANTRIEARVISTYQINI